MSDLKATNNTQEFLQTLANDIKNAGCHDISKLYLGRREWLESGMIQHIQGVRVYQAVTVDSGIHLVIEGVGECAWERE